MADYAREKVHDAAEKIAEKTAVAPPPHFGDLAKSANDLINKDFYHANATALEVKLKSPDGLAITTKGTSPHSGDIAGSLEAKKLLAKGITSTLTYTTAGLVTTKVELDNNIADGFKAEVVSNFNPKEGFNRAQAINLHFKQGLAHVRAFGDYTPSTGAMIARLDAVAAHEGFLVGGEASYDVQKAALTKYSVALGYSKAPYLLALTGTNNLSVLTALYYHRVNAAVEAGVKASYDLQESKPTGIELATKYKVDPLSFVKAKVNDRGIVALAYNTKVNPGLTLGLGLSLDGQKINEGGHKVGASFTFEG